MPMPAFLRRMLGLKTLPQHEDSPFGEEPDPEAVFRQELKQIVHTVSREILAEVRGCVAQTIPAHLKSQENIMVAASERAKIAAMAEFEQLASRVDAAIKTLNNGQAPKTRKKKPATKKRRK